MPKTKPETSPRPRRGGQQRDDRVQNRPEQNAGYDAAVHDGPSGTTSSDLGIDVLGEGRRGVTVITPETEDDAPLLDIDARAERGAIADVRHRERPRRT